MNYSKVGLPIGFKIVLIIIGIVIVLAIINASSKKVTVDETITDVNQMTRFIEHYVSEYKSNIVFYTTMEPSTIDFDMIFHDIMASNTYIGCELFAFSYTYVIEPDGRYKMDLTIRDPAAHRVELTKMRVQQIAGHLEGLSDYDKIKTVHDYLILNNEYSSTIGSAFNALYVGKSACNGYAYSFYAIMKELGIPVTCEYGGSHAWNKVMLDGEWYNIDVTWDDKGGKNIGYDYFLKCDADFGGHDHAGATAKESVDGVDMNPSPYCNQIPNYRIILVVFVVLLFAIYLIVMRIMSNKQRAKIHYE